MILDSGDPNIAGADAESIPGDAVSATPGDYDPAAPSMIHFRRSED